MKDKNAGWMENGKKFFQKFAKAKIKPYEGSDAVYSSSDSEYAEFLQNLKKGDKQKNKEGVKKTVKQSAAGAAEKTAQPTAKPSQISEVLTELKKRTIDSAGKNEERDKYIRTAMEELSEKISSLSERKDAAGEEFLRILEENRVKLSEELDALKAELPKDSSAEKFEEISEKISTLAGVQLDIKNQNARSRAQLENLILNSARMQERVGDIYQGLAVVEKMNEGVNQIKRTQQELKDMVNDFKERSETMSRRIFNGMLLLSALVAAALIVIVIQLFI